MSEDKYRGLLGDDGYIDYDGILNLIEENDRMKREIDKLNRALSAINAVHFPKK